MAEYKKKNVKKRKRSAKNLVAENVVMKQSKSPAANKSENNKNSAKQSKAGNIHIIRGNKRRNRNRRLINFAILSIIFVLVILVSLITPTGVLEYISNSVAALKIGNGYPIKLSGGNIINTQPQGNHYFSLSTTNFECYNNNGENIFSYQHGYESPVLATSEARTLLYDQSGKEFSIYNLKKEIRSGTTDKEILTASIARNGNYAIATLSDSYSSQVTVYNKSGDKIYEWFCSDYIVNNVLLSPNGKKLAVSVFNASGGKFVSKLYILEFDSATPKALFDYDALILNLSKTGNAGFCCVFENSAKFFRWNKINSEFSFSTEENIFISRTYKNNTLLITGREANKNENNVTVFDANGKVKSSFVFNGVIETVEYKGGNIYFLSENNIYFYSINGELLTQLPCEFGIENIVPISRREVATVSDNSISKISF